MSRTLKAIERHMTPPSKREAVDPHAPKLAGEWQQRGPETFSGYALRKLRLAFAPAASDVQALSAQAKTLAGIHAWRNADLGFPVKGRHFHCSSQSRFPRRDFHFDLGIVGFHGEEDSDFEATTTIMRSEWGMKYALPKAVSDEIKLTIPIEAYRE